MTTSVERAAVTGAIGHAGTMKNDPEWRQNRYAELMAQARFLKSQGNTEGAEAIEADAEAFR